MVVPTRGFSGSANLIIITMTRSDQPEPPAVAIVRQNGLSSASSRASVADTPVSRQIWWTQVGDGRPQELEKIDSLVDNTLMLPGIFASRNYLDSSFCIPLTSALITVRDAYW